MNNDDNLHDVNVLLCNHNFWFDQLIKSEKIKFRKMLIVTRCWMTRKI